MCVYKTVNDWPIGNLYIKLQNEKKCLKTRSRTLSKFNHLETAILLIKHHHE